jgi:predicted phage terminase large subunit-like protein
VQALRELDRFESRTLAGFIRRAWHVLEPGVKYVHGWHIDAMAEHLEAVSAGVIRRLIICVPPGAMKSMLVGVMWPAWEWGPLGKPELRVIATSHKEPLAVRDNLKCRRLIESPWYQDLWGAGSEPPPSQQLAYQAWHEQRWPGASLPPQQPDKRVLLTSDQNAKTKFENTRGGFREAMAFTSMTGSRGDRVSIDDPMSVDDAKSEAKREAIITTFLEAVPTRVNDPELSAIVIIQQRLHAKDVVGVAIAKELGYEQLVLPMELDREPATRECPSPPLRRCRTALGFVDPRTREGELLFPERFSREVVDRDKRTMGSYATAGQFQQRPVPREGALFKRHWFQYATTVPRGTRWARHWDLAGTKDGEGARTAGVKLGRTPDGRFIVGHVVLAREEGAEVRKLIKSTAISDKKLHGPSLQVSLPVDPGQAGKTQARDYVKLLAGHNVRVRRETGDKVTRAEPVAAQAEAGNVYLLEGDWNEGFLDEVCLFPGGALKDQVDALSGAFNALLTPTASSTGLGGAVAVPLAA